VPQAASQSHASTVSIQVAISSWASAKGSSRMYFEGTETTMWSLTISAQGAGARRRFSHSARVVLPWMKIGASTAPTISTRTWSRDLAFFSPPGMSMKIGPPNGLASSTVRLLSATELQMTGKRCQLSRFVAPTMSSEWQPMRATSPRSASPEARRKVIRSPGAA